MSVADKMADQFVPEVDPNPAEPRMVIWSTLRCLELQIDQHEELYDSHGVVSWELLKHMVRLAKRHAHEEGGKREAAERETDQWRTRADEANATLRETEQELDRLRKRHVEVQSEEVAAARAEIETLKGAMAADDQRLRDAEERVWPGVTWGCDAPDKLAEEILHLRQQLAEQQAETVDVRRQRNNETDRLNATNAVSVQQRDEIAYLRTRLDEERSVSAGLRQQLDAANVTILAQKRGIQYLRLLIDKVRGIVGRDDAMSERLEQISQALDEFDHGTIEPTPSPEVERLQAFVTEVREAVNLRSDVGLVPVLNRVMEALAELDAGTEPTPVAETLDGKGGQ